MTKFVDPQTGKLIQAEPSGHDLGTAEKIADFRTFTVEYGMYRLGYRQELAERVADDVVRAAQGDLSNSCVF